MGGFDRCELEDFWQSWLEANRTADRAGDWTGLARFYAPDATFAWTCSATDHFLATGRDEIRDWALGTEMHGYQGWRYPYQASVIDDHTGQIVGFWRMVSTFGDLDGRPYEVQGIGCSWFQYAGDRQWAWQRDVYDIVTEGATLVQVIQDGRISREAEQRIHSQSAGSLPGHHSSVEAMRSPLWPVPRVD